MAENYFVKVLIPFIGVRWIGGEEKFELANEILVVFDTSYVNPYLLNYGLSAYPINLST